LFKNGANKIIEGNQGILSSRTLPQVSHSTSFLQKPTTKTVDLRSRILERTCFSQASHPHTAAFLALAASLKTAIPQTILGTGQYKTQTVVMFLFVGLPKDLKGPMKLKVSFEEYVREQNMCLQQPNFQGLSLI